MKQVAIISFCLLISLPALAQKHFLIGKTSDTYKMHDSTGVRIFAFTRKLIDPSIIPAPTLEANEGDTMRITLWNVSQGPPHTIHPHGLDVDQQNDGVPHLSFTLGHMDSATYKFVAPHAGTYLYHCHVVSAIHVQAGMYGMIIIRPPNGDKFITWAGGYTYTRETSWLLSELDINWHIDSILEHEHDSTMHLMPVYIPLYYPGYFLLNGLSNPRHTEPNVVLSRDTSYLRVANVGNYANRIIFPADMNARIVSSDGRPLPTPELNDTLWVYPGERFGVFLEPSQKASDDSVRIDFADLNNLDIQGTKWVMIDFDVTVQESHAFPFDWRVAPNPTNGQLSIHYNTTGAEVITISMITLDGRTVMIGTDTWAGSGRWSATLDDPELPNGQYIVRLTLEDDRTSSAKFILVR